MNGLKTSWYTEARELTRFELSLGLAEVDEKIIGKVDYDDSIFSAQTTSQMLEDYLQLLKFMTADPEMKLASVSLANTSAAAASLEL